MMQCENSIRYFSSNFSLQDFLNSTERDYREENEKANVLGPLIYNTLLLNQFFSKIQVYSKYNYSAMQNLTKQTPSIHYIMVLL